MVSYIPTIQLKELQNLLKNEASNFLFECMITYKV